MRLELLSDKIKIIPETFLEEEYLRNFTLQMTYSEFEGEHQNNSSKLDKVLALYIPKS
jgi:hypothetical protein